MCAKSLKILCTAKAMITYLLVNKLFIGINIPYETYLLFTHNKQNYYLNSFQRMSDIQIHHVLIHWIITYRMRCSRCTNVTHQSQPHLLNWRTVWKRSALTCLKAQISATILVFHKGLQECKKQPVDISNRLSELILLTSATFHVFYNK